MVLSLAFALAPAKEAQAAPGAWTQLPYPRAGVLSGYVLGPVGGVTLGPGVLEKAIDGTLYTFFDVGDPTDLYKSTNGGRSWVRCATGAADPLGNAPFAGTVITNIACSPVDANTLYVGGTIAAGNYRIYKSSDAGASFIEISQPTVVLANMQLTGLDVGYDGTSHWIVIGTDDTTNAADGDILARNDVYGGQWVAQNVGSFGGTVISIWGVACSPNFEAEGTLAQVVAVVADAGTGSTYLTWQYGTGGTWLNIAACPQFSLDTDGATFAAIALQADIAFPDGYTSVPPTAMDLFVGLNNAVIGSVYEVIGFAAIDLNPDGGVAGTVTPVSSIDVQGGAASYKMLAAESALGANLTRHTENAGTSWLPSRKAPFGVVTQNRYVVMADDYYDSGKAFVTNATPGGALDGSGFSITGDFGDTWTQISMMNININAVNNLAFSADYGSSGAMFMITSNSAPADESIWRYDVTYFDRVFTKANINAVQVAPDDANFVYALDQAAGGGLITYISRNGGYWFIPTRGTPAAPNGAAGWVVVYKDTVIISNAAGTGLQRTTNAGNSWLGVNIAGVGAGIPTSFAVAPGDSNTLLMGDNAANASIFMSLDKGWSWFPIPAGVPLAGGGGTFTNVAFDADYATNNTVYAAASDTNDVYRLVNGTDTQWFRIDGASPPVNWPAASTAGIAFNANNWVPGIQVAPDGTMYLVDANAANVVLRSVNPTDPTVIARGVYFEPMGVASFTGAAAGLIGIWYTAGSNTLWTIENAATDAIWTYTDAVSVEATLTGPADASSTGRTTTATLTWDSMPTATVYEVWVGINPEFSPFFTGFPAFSATPGWLVTGLQAGITYYWKVCSASATYAAPNTGRNVSPWSETYTFTTGLAAAEWNPFTGGVSETPYPGQTGVPVATNFAWNAADWATGYEFVLSANADYSSPVAEETVTSSTYDYAGTLDYGTTYYWKVRAVSATSASNWAEGIFTTATTGVVSTPMYIWIVIAIGAVLVIAVIWLIFTTRRT